METFDYELFVKLLCKKGILFEMKEEVKHFYAELNNKERDIESKAFFSYVITKSSLEQIQDPIYKDLVEKFLKENCNKFSNEVCFRRLLSFLKDYFEESRNYYALKRRKWYSDITALIEKILERKIYLNLKSMHYRYSTPLIRSCYEGVTTTIPSELIDYFIEHKPWEKYFVAIKHNSIDVENGSTVSNCYTSLEYWRGIYYKYHSDWGLSGPYLDGDIVEYNNVRYLLKGGKAKKAEYDLKYFYPYD